MIRKADTLGTFQIESQGADVHAAAAQPRTFYDLVVQVAIVRPGPIQGDMVHPYLRRREGLEPVHYPKPGRLSAWRDAKRYGRSALSATKPSPSSPPRQSVKRRSCQKFQSSPFL